MRTLDLKLLRELRRHWVQVISIALVMGCGTMTIMGLRSTLTSIRAARDKYYADYRFGDVFVQLQRAPSAVARRKRGSRAMSVWTCLAWRSRRLATWCRSPTCTVRC
jgi:hypothetical protein